MHHEGPRPAAGPLRAPTTGERIGTALRRRLHGLVLESLLAVSAFTDPAWRRRLTGPWRVAVAEASMLPALRPGDWLLVDPTTRRWPRRGSLVVVTEPLSGSLAVKRLAGRPGDRVPFAGGYLVLGDDEAWLASDADEATTAAAGFGPPIDSRRYGPVPLGHLVGRAWFRYGPLGRVGRLPGQAHDHRPVWREAPPA
jgi:signal peptidase I